MTRDSVSLDQPRESVSSRILGALYIVKFDELSLTPKCAVCEFASSRIITD
jgi:hypothetical protein